MHTFSSSEPTLSVVIPNYNHAEHLPRAFDELLNQTRPADEILLLDDASTDNSREIMQQYANQHACIKLLFNEQNLGVVASQRILFEAATGDYVYAGAVDDVRLPSFFERAMEMAKKKPTAGMICGKMASVDEEGNRLGLIEIPHWTTPHYAPPHEVVQTCFDLIEPSHSLSASSIYRRDVLESVGWFQEELSSWGDTFAARAVALKAGLCYIPEEFVHWTCRTDSFSGAVRTDPKATLELIEQAAQLMLTAPFDELFPVEHVRHWRHQYWRRVLLESLQGVYESDQPESPVRLVRWVKRLQRLPVTYQLWKSVPQQKI